ncbi:DeoR/GlpR family DNA-binding transcription regulator [Isoptericola sp. NPDC019482]|uniref:DeoR/GlpR family DNA-binding transcription regulator n=1 Tax=Isoptericola sp. NPDC019482 TaxID=3154688 RepID=UPI00347605A7
MNARNRREEIVRLARTRGVLSVESLSETLGVTASTIRRDLARLTADGALARTYGGVMAMTPHPESGLAERSEQATAAKRAIGDWCAAQVTAGETVLLDAGTTSAQVARALRGTTPLDAVTVGLTPLGQLSGVDGIEVTLLGGRLRDISQGFVGPLTEAALERLTFDAVFLGADAVTAEDGVCEATLEQTRLKELMARRAARVYVVAHAEKLGKRPFHAWAALAPGWTLVTDDGATDAQVAPFEARGITVVRVDTQDESSSGPDRPA